MILSLSTLRRRHDRAFSLVEMVLVSAMSAAVIGAAVLVFHAIGMRQRRTTDYGSLTLGSAVLENFYGLTGTGSLNTWYAPNYGRGLRADEMRDLFWQDVEAASAVFALPRAGRSSVRPTSIPLSASMVGVEIDTPAAFLTQLATSDAAVSTTFSSYRGVPAATTKNASVFVLQPSANGSGNTLAVRAIWEIDFVTVDSNGGLAGTYASVRRYVGAQLTHYYDVFYKDNTAAFGPVMVHFERAARASDGSATASAAESFKKAGNQSFYFMWWPDPAAPKLNASGSSDPTDASGASIAGGDFRRNYTSHFGQTSLFFVVPMFPCVR